MADIWKIGEKAASEVYDDFKNGMSLDGTKGLFLRVGDIHACYQMAQVCDEMRADYENVIKDNNDYILEFETINGVVDNLQKELQEKLDKLKKEIAELLAKQEDGTITEEKKQELSDKQLEYSELIKTGNPEIAKTAEDFNNRNQERAKKHEETTRIAVDFGETTVEKATPLAETHVSHGFFKKLFGKTGKNKKKAGERAVEAGKALLEKVDEVKPDETKITQANIRL